MSSHSHYEPLISPPTCEVPEWPLTNDLQLPIHALTQGSFGKLENNTSEEFQSILEALDSKDSKMPQDGPASESKDKIKTTKSEAPGKMIKSTKKEGASTGKVNEEVNEGHGEDKKDWKVETSRGSRSVIRNNSAGMEISACSPSINCCTM